jgi:hypothetical protein
MPFVGRMHAGDRTISARKLNAMGDGARRWEKVSFSADFQVLNDQAGMHVALNTDHHSSKKWGRADDHGAWDRIDSLDGRPEPFPLVLLGHATLPHLASDQNGLASSNLTTMWNRNAHFVANVAGSEAVSGEYNERGSLNGKHLYLQERRFATSQGRYFLWYDSGSSIWTISTSKGSGAGDYWTSSGTDIEGQYAPQGTGSSVAVTAGGITYLGSSIYGERDMRTDTFRLRDYASSGTSPDWDNHLEKWDSYENIWNGENFNVTVRATSSPPTGGPSATDQAWGNINLRAFTTSGESLSGDVFIWADDSVHIDADDDIRVRAGNEFTPAELGSGDNVNILAKTGVLIRAGSSGYTPTLLTGAGDMTLATSDDLAVYIRSSTDNLQVWNGAQYVNGLTGTYSLQPSSGGAPQDIRFVHGWATAG